METKINVPFRIVKAMYNIQEYCKRCDNCDCACAAECKAISPITLPEKWGITEADVKRWKMAYLEKGSDDLAVR